LRIAVPLFRSVRAAGTLVDADPFLAVQNGAGIFQLDKQGEDRVKDQESQGTDEADRDIDQPFDHENA
jgi:hypothetical protein